MLEMLFRTSSKGFYAFFDDKDSVVCIKTEPFKARFCGFFLLWLTPCNPLGRYAQNDKIF